MKRWWHRRRFLVAYRILRNTGERHKAAGHQSVFNANGSYVCWECLDCPDVDL
jgi:NAD-dependent SIR2 family protein deacetylase